MAIGDVTSVDLKGTMTAVPTATSISNPSAQYQTIISYLTFTTGAGVTATTVSVFKNGDATGDCIMTIDIDPTGVSAPKTVILDNQAILLQATGTLSFSAPTGTDINVYVSGIKEDITGGGM